MPEWSLHWTRNQMVPGLSPALATCWIFSQSFRVLSPQPSGCLLPVGVFNPVMFCLPYLFQEYLGGVPVN